MTKVLEQLASNDDLRLAACARDRCANRQPPALAHALILGSCALHVTSHASNTIMLRIRSSSLISRGQCVVVCGVDGLVVDFHRQSSLWATL